VSCEGREKGEREVPTEDAEGLTSRAAVLAGAGAGAELAARDDEEVCSQTLRNESGRGPRGGL